MRLDYERGGAFGLLISGEEHIHPGCGILGAAPRPESIAMNRCLCSLALLIALAPTTVAIAEDAKKAKPESLPRVSALWNDLAQPMSAEPFVKKMTLKNALALLQKRIRERQGRELPILIIDQAFKDENPEAPDLNDVEVFLRPHPRVRTTGQILRDLLVNVPTGNATYFLKPGVIEITTSDAAHISRQLGQSVDLKFMRQPLSFVLEEIYEQTGVHVILDPRVGINARAPVTITFTNEMALGTGLVLIAEMAGLRLVETDNTVFITTPAVAQRYWWERGGGQYISPSFQLYRGSSTRKEAAAVPLPNPVPAGQ
jgi:hypothetical protein